MRDKEIKKPMVALVIGSGGLKCAAALGIFEALEKENIGIDMVVGCSGGAIMGAFIVTGRSSEETIDLVNRMWDPKIVQQFRLKNILKALFPKILGFNESFGLTEDTMMVKQYEKAYGFDTSFSDTKIPFFCVATNIKNGEPVVISEGRVADAVRMSSGFPILFEGIERNEKVLIDGGLSNPLPVDVAIKEGADIIVAVGFESPKLPNIVGVGSFISQMFSILTNQLLSFKMAFYGLAHHSEIVIIAPEFGEEISLTDVHKLPFIIEQGEQEVGKHFDYIKQLLTSDFANKKRQND
jgi:NTE family protein